jgi:hypothetical protein
MSLVTLGLGRSDPKRLQTASDGLTWAVPFTEGCQPPPGSQQIGAPTFRSLEALFGSPGLDSPVVP